MNRLTSGTVSLFALLLVGACNNDPTSSTNNDQVAQINASPSTLNVTHGKVSKFQVSAVNEAGNPVSTAYELKSVGPGITVVRDSSFFPIFVGDNNTLTVPPAATTFQYNVTGSSLVSTSITVSAAGKEVTIPVIVLPDPANDTVTAAVTQSGPNPTDAITAAIPSPFQFPVTGSILFSGSTVVSGDGSAVVTQRAADGSSVQFLALPGSTGNGTVVNSVINYATNIPLTMPFITSPVTVAATNPPALGGTDDISTAPVIDLSTGVGGVLDAGTFGAANCGFNSGAPCQLYKFTVPDSSTVHVRMQWPNDADMGLYFLNSDGSDFSDASFKDLTTLCDNNGRASGAAEECDDVFPPGDYFAAVVSFGPFYPLPGHTDPTDPASGGPDPNPPWVALQLEIVP